MTASLPHWKVPVQWAHYRCSLILTVTYFVGVRANGHVLLRRPSTTTLIAACWPRPYCLAEGAVAKYYNPEMDISVSSRFLNGYKCFFMFSTVCLVRDDWKDVYNIHYTSNRPWKRGKCKQCFCQDLLVL